MKVEHGGNVFALAKAFGYDIKDCLDFSANINPFGLSPTLKEGIVTSLEQLVHYPDVHYTRAKETIAQHHQVSKEAVLLANGAVEIFYDVARVLKPNKVLLLQPTFMEYEKAFLQVGSDILYVTLQEPDYSWDFSSLLPQLEQLAVGDLVLICHPNNPTGTLADKATLLQLATYLKERQILLLLDEAFIDFLPEENDLSFVSHLADFPNVLVVRSLTKFYAIPGLRLGYALSYNASCLSDIEAYRPPWTVNALAEAAIGTIFKDKDYQNKTREWLAEEKIFLYDSLKKMRGITPLKPSVNYVFFKYQGDLDLREALWQSKIFIRSCANYHSLTHQHYRIAVRSRRENEVLIQALTTLLGRETADEKD